VVPSLAELEAELGKLQERLRVTAALVEAMRAYEATVGAKVHESRDVSVRQRVRPSGIVVRPMSDTERAAIRVMIRTGGPVPTAAVVQEMLDLGMQVPAANAINIISARLSNNHKFKGRRGVGYWFADKPWPGDAEKLALDAPNENEAPTEGSEDASEAAQDPPA
jgi:hypothetical protein